MRHVKLFLAAATVLFAPVAALSAEPVPEPSATKISMLGPGPSPVTALPNSTSKFAIVSDSPVVEIAARRGLESRPQKVKPLPVRRAMPAVAPPCRPVARRARPSFASSRSPARVAKPAVASRVTAPRALACLTGSGWQCGAVPYTKVVLLGVGF
ncbi:MAG: hypothetical protein L0Y50_10735 [Beijerinckiaceae bacterium]|nr:hypothetical protein [Beijerinckiaceae bacterium]